MLGMLALTACGGGGLTTVGGTVSGLNTGTAVTLVNNGSDTLAVASNGSFTFGPKYDAGSAYDVAIAVQPEGLACSIANGSGRIDSNASKVDTIVVACAPGLSVGGSVSGLASGNSVTIQNNGGDSLTIGANSTFVFPGLLLPGASYTVTVVAQPSGQTCAVSQGSGTVVNSNVSNVVVSCS